MTTGDSTANKELKKEIIETHSAQETFALGQRIGLEALPGQVYTLIGDLGVGKGGYDMLPARRPDSPKAPSVPHGTEDAVPLSEKAEKNGRGTVKEKRTVRNAKVKKTKAKNKGMSM